MKKLVVMWAVVLFSLTAKSELLVYNHLNFEYTNFIYDVCDELGIKETIYVIETNVDVDGFVRRIDSGYVVFVNRNSICKKETIAHELVHVKQDLKKQWDINNGTRRLTLSGIEYVSKKAKEIEKEANEVGKQLYRKYGRITRN